MQSFSRHILQHFVEKVLRNTRFFIKKRGSGYNASSSAENRLYEAARYLPFPNDTDEATTGSGSSRNSSPSI
ncbi:MAG TPA: hypothetical protein VFE47_30595 [Tepidisphaeraceae bacterium]|jgi:hypothetical protein|nr:hypothetical protein [Tepidisphaeraceae bacterium]